MTHALGPLEAHQRSDGDWLIVDERNNLAIGVAWENVEQLDEVNWAKAPAKENAQLWASAPEMLKVLQEAARGKMVNNWLTAGRDVCLVCGELPDEPHHVHDEDCWVPKAEAAIAKALGQTVKT